MQRSIRSIFSSVLLVALAALPAAAQDRSQPADSGVVRHHAFRLGIYAGWARNFHETDATLFTGGGECGAFNNGSGYGPAVGIVGEMPIVGTWLDAVVSMLYAGRGGNFGEVYTSGLPILDPNTGQYTLLQRRHNYEATLNYVIGSLGLQVNPFEEIPLYLRASGTVGHIPGTPTHRQTEEILAPSGVVYPETNATIREVSSGPITGAGTTFGLAGAVGYRLPLGQRLSASPEISYYYPLNDVTPYYRWRISSLQAGVLLSWTFGGDVEPQTPEPPVEIADHHPSTDASSIVLTQIPPQDISIVETIVTETFPLLPYIFFDSASATIPNRYVMLGTTDRATFDERALPHRSLGTYYNVLNIVGNRMLRDSSIHIRLNGTTDRKEETVPGAVDNLARSRAQEVKDYLVKQWGIDPSRVAVTTTSQPAYPSSMEYVEGAQENRRVEITSDADDILAPILHERFSEYAVEPKQFRFSTGDGVKGVTSWGLKVSTGGSLVWEQSGLGDLPATLSWPLTREMMAAIGDASHKKDSLYCELTVMKDGKATTAHLAIPSSKTRYPFEVSRLSLIVFDFDKSEITSQNRRMVSSFIARSISPAATATIVGSTDRLGELKHNQELSEARALAVRDLIAGERPNAAITSTKGIGPGNLLYDNDLPEGRYYCRTVTVEVKTPAPETTPQ